MDVQVETSGPLFTGAVHRAVGRGLEQAVTDVGERGETMVRQRLGSVLQNPTGYYESRIDTLAQGDHSEVTDGGVIYGSWLEGESSRNQSTRFPGYHTFRMVAQELDKQAEPLANAAVGKALGGVG